MTPLQIELARHALGLPNSKRTSYRNHFVTGEGGDDHAAWSMMVNEGDALRRKGSVLTGGDDLFLLTHKGAEKALKNGEKLDHEDFPEARKI